MIKIQFAILLFSFELEINAQNYLGVITSNYGGVMSTDLQPASFVDGRGQFLAVLSAASTVAALPVILAGWLAQKQLVRGLAMGAVK